MALNQSLCTQESDGIARACEVLLDALEAHAQRAVSHNQALAINWTANPLPAYIPVETEAQAGIGNMVGRNWTPADVSNSVGSLDAIVNFAVTNGHVGNLRKMARPSGLR